MNEDITITDDGIAKSIKAIREFLDGVPKEDQDIIVACAYRLAEIASYVRDNGIFEVKITGLYNAKIDKELGDFIVTARRA